MAEPIYITDLSACERKSALTDEAQPGCWSLWEYQTEPHKGAAFSGKMLYADGHVDPPPLTLPLGATGWHEIYLGFYYSDFPTEHYVRVRLGGDDSFDRVASEPTSPKDGNHTEQNINFGVLAETLWRTADLTGKGLEIARPNMAGLFGRDGYSSLAYIKLVPLSAAQLAEHRKLEPTDATKRLVAVFDGSGSSCWGPVAIEDLWEDIDAQLSVV